MYMKFQRNFNDWVQRYGKKHQKCYQNGVFLPFVTLKDFFKLGSVTWIQKILDWW